MSDERDVRKDFLFEHREWLYHGEEGAELLAREAKKRRLYQNDLPSSSYSPITRSYRGGSKKGEE
ncbi:hypothetical protein D6783_01555 [Candidatus Woesearchaeota archaeon]|nr:MAG: hypothetical protein D6783_01555 [Candidatus Woesearchaeota archaeon]